MIGELLLKPPTKNVPVTWNDEACTHWHWRHQQPYLWMAKIFLDQTAKPKKTSQSVVSSSINISSILEQRNEIVKLQTRHKAGSPLGKPESCYGPPTNINSLYSETNPNGAPNYLLLPVYANIIKTIGRTQQTIITWFFSTFARNPKKKRKNNSHILPPTRIKHAQWEGSPHNSWMSPIFKRGPSPLRTGWHPLHDHGLRSADSFRCSSNCHFPAPVSQI